ncbi:MAG: pyrroline-5-carboxylate reductase [Gordonibacter sp.]
MALTDRTRIALIGGGKMGEAIMGGWIAASEHPADRLTAANFTVANPGEERRVYLQGRYGVACVADARAIEGADVVVLAVKPQVMMGVLEQIAEVPAYVGGKDGPLFVSIAAGLCTERLEGALPAGARLVRTMPNTPLLVGAGATTVAGGAQADEADVALVRDLFACLGAAYVIDEDDMDATGAVSGSGPAYVAALIEALRDGGAAQGLEAGLAEALAQQTVYGTALLMRETGQDAQTTRVAVCSPGGSTLAALAAMEEAGFARSLDAGVAAAVCRSKELGQC